MMLPKIQYRSAELKQALVAWSRGLGIRVESPVEAYEEHLSEWCASHFDATIATIDAIKSDRDVMMLSVSSDGWAGQKEIALLPDGGLAW
jgi:hypothetical protein